MNWLDKLERKWGRHAIPHITRYMIMANLIGYALYYVYVYTQMDLLTPLMFSAKGILHGQIWRLITWIFIPSSSFNFWELLFILCLLMLGENLERGLGSFRMTVYFGGAIVLSDIGALLVYLLCHVDVGSGQTLYYALFSMYLMLGLFIPDAEVRLYFVLPIRMKYMVVVYFIMFALELWNNFSYGFSYGLALSSDMVFALLNLFLFVAACKHRMSPHQAAKQKVRQQQYRQQTRPVNYGPAAGGALHKCVICGRTELTNPELTFRYCSKCTGAKEYCNDHLFTHQHV